MFSVIIPLYNKEQSISNTIQSVLDQTFQDFEIVVVNDGSTDKSVERVKEFKDSRIFIIDKLNGGVSSARNIGIEAANFEWIAFLDGDDFWETDYLFEMNSLINDFPDSILYGANYFVQNESARSVQSNILSENFRGIISNYYKTALNGLLYWTSSTIVNKNKLNGVLFDERITLGEDLDFWIRLSEKGPTVYYNKPLAVYNHDGPNRAMNKKHDIEKNFIYYTERYESIERRSHDFRILINNIRIKKIPEVFLSSNATNNQIKDYLSLIDYSDQSIKHRCFSLFPFSIKRIVVSLIFKV